MDIRVKTPLMSTLLWIMGGGAFGTGLRYWISTALNRDAFPIGTLTVNLVGCLLIGLLSTWFSHLLNISDAVRLGIIVGFLGGFTTFSSFGLDTIRLIEDGRMTSALTYVVVSNLVGVLAVWIGIKGARIMGLAG